MDKEVADVLRQGVADVLEQARNPPQPQNAHQTITLHHATPHPSPPWHVWICVTCCLVILAALGVAVPLISSAHNEVKADIRALEDDNDSVRAYINTGILKPKTEKRNAE